MISILNKRSKPIYYADTAGAPEWTSSVKITGTQAIGDRDVLIIVSKDVSNPDAVRRRAGIELTDELRENLESQGIEREEQSDDLSIIKTRYGMEKRFTIADVEMSGQDEGKLTRDGVLNRIETLMKKSDQGGSYTYILLSACRYNIPISI